MAFNLQDFKSRGVPLGGARPSLFDVQITFPPSVATTIEQNRLTFQCQATTLPDSTIGSVNVFYFGRSIKLNGERQFRDWTIEIINDEDFVVRNALERWHNNINGVISNVMDPSVASITGANSYKVTALVRQYTKVGAPNSPGNNEGDVIKQYRFDGLFPVNIGDIRVGWDRTNQIETYSVDFAYDWWEPEYAGVQSFGGEPTPLRGG